MNETKELAMHFEDRNSAFTAEADHFNEALSRYQARCVGQGAVKK